jgi:sec-independent protein translocase protein TatA
MLAFLNLMGPWHLAVILIVALLLFGNRLPEVARSFGRSINEFKKGMREINNELDEDPPEKLNPPHERDQTVKREQQTDREKEPSDSRQD